MPRGVPSFGQKSVDDRAMRDRILGTMPLENPITTAPEETTTTWTREDGTVVELTEPAPPWEQRQEGFSMSDARRFVDCPPQWKLRWINPRVLESEGWRDWQAMLASDHRVSVRVSSMVTPEGYIRRGGPNGDILCWMWPSWYESKTRQHLEKTSSQSQHAVDQQSELKERFAGGEFPGVSLESAQHPKFTQGDGRTMRD
jgi:hypothetical protein